MAEIFRLGTRGSPLALAQAALTRGALEEAFPGLLVETVVIKTTGDKDRVRSLVAMGGQGVFVKELEQALEMGHIDVAVHSLKDVPSAMAPGLCLAGYLKREDPRDALVSRHGGDWRSLPTGALVGTGSPRRVLQLKALRPDLRCVDLRGNLESRLRKVDDGDLDAILLGCAGLNRLGYAGHISYAFDFAEMVPAIAQGIVGLQTAKANKLARRYIDAISDKAAATAADVERSVMAALGGGCRVPMAALCEAEFDQARRLHLYLGNPSDGRGSYHCLDFPTDRPTTTAYEEWLSQVVAKCREDGIPLPCDVDEHALMEFWGAPEKLP